MRDGIGKYVQLSPSITIMAGSNLICTYFSSNTKNIKRRSTITIVTTNVS